MKISTIAIAVLFCHASLNSFGLCGTRVAGSDSGQNNDSLDQDEDEKILLHVNRYLGFRSADDVNDESDYSFQLSSDGKWTCRAMKSGKETSGTISKNLTEIVAVLQAIEIDQKETDSSIPRVADAPSFKLTINKESENDGKNAGGTMEMFPKADLAKMLHAAIRDWREDRPVVPRMLIRRLEIEGLDVLAAQTRFGDPQLFEAKEELAAKIESSELLDQVCEQVDFEKQKLILFTWSGSGQDRLNYEIDFSNDKVHFSFTPGRTRDLRSHIKLFVVDVGVEIEK